VIITSQSQYSDQVGLAAATTSISINIVGSSSCDSFIFSLFESIAAAFILKQQQRQQAAAVASALSLPSLVVSSGSSSKQQQLLIHLLYFQRLSRPLFSKSCEIIHNSFSPLLSRSFLHHQPTLSQTYVQLAFLQTTKSNSSADGGGRRVRIAPPYQRRVPLLVRQKYCLAQRRGATP
jgi:hypothetical protein